MKVSMFRPSLRCGNVPGALTPLEHPLVQATLAARDRVVGAAQERHPDNELSPGDDGKLFARAGIPYVNGARMETRC